MTKISVQDLAAGAASRRRPDDIDADVQTTIYGKAGQEVAAPKMVKLAEIVASRYQSRARMDEAYMETLVEGIRMEGLHDPIILRPLAPAEGEKKCDSITPRFELVAGHHRVEAFRRLGRTEIPAFIRALSDAEAARALTTENTNRKNLAHWELFKHMQMLRDVGAIRYNTELARLLNIDRTAIPQLDAFGLLPQAAKDLLDDNPELFGYNLAYKLKPYLPAHGMLVFDALDLLAKGKLSQAAVPGWIEDRANPKKPKYRKDVQLAGGVRIVLAEDGARVSGNIDYDRLHKLVEDNLGSLLRPEK